MVNLTGRRALYVIQDRAEATNTVRYIKRAARLIWVTGYCKNHSCCSYIVKFVVKYTATLSTFTYYVY